jgi:hypothetical protein
MKKKNSMVAHAILQDMSDILITNQIAELPNSNFSYSIFKAEDFYVGRIQMIFNPNIQRMYLFNDVKLSDGHPWQRNLFKSYLKGEPVGTVELWVNPNGDYEVLDAQQRLKTLKAIFGDCVKTPKNCIIDGVDCSEMHYSSLPSIVRNKLVNYQFLVTISKTSQDDAVQRFIDLNSGNPLSAQDKRSPQVSDFAEHIRTITDFENPLFEFARFIHVDGKLQLRYFNFPHHGRTLDEILSYTFNVIYKDNGDVQSYSQSDLNNLYKTMKASPNEFTDEDRKIFGSILKTLDKLVRVKNWNVKDTKKKELIYLLLLLNKINANGGSISDPDAFIKQYYKVIKECRKNKSLLYNAPNGEISDFATVWRLGTGAPFMNWILQNIFQSLNNIGVIYKDEKRTFSRSEIESKLEEQDCKCAYCSKDLELSEAIGDHMIPHARGGKTIYDNLAVSCFDCNSMKSSLPWEGWVHAVKAMNGIDLSNLQIEDKKSTLIVPQVTD